MPQFLPHEKSIKSIFFIYSSFFWVFGKQDVIGCGYWTADGKKWKLAVLESLGSYHVCPFVE